MVMNSGELRKRHMAVLREKYQVDQGKKTSCDDFLYLILRKAELGIQIASLEFQWLKQNSLFKTIEMISLQQYQSEDFQRLEVELLNLRSKYKIPEHLDLPVMSPLYSILWKVKSGGELTESEFECLNSYGLVETTCLIQEMLNFSKLKTTYQATKYRNCFPEEPLYSILKKLDAREALSSSDIDWLLMHGFKATLQIHWQQEEQRKAAVEFSDLKVTYGVASFPDTSISSPLFTILKKIKEKQELDENECEWLEQQKLTQIVENYRRRKNVKLFRKLKKEYQATQYQSSDPSSPLFLILKNIASVVTEDDIQWLINEELLETAEIAKATHLKILKAKYQIVGQLAVDPFYEIMLKLEREERLDPKQVIQLIEDGYLSRHGKIATAYYRLEAIFYEKEYQRTGNRWNLPSASSNWRKADEPEHALRVTEQINWNKVQESDLKSALLVTRGASFRDLGRLDEAEDCAAQAMDCQPQSHQPYTLMGAISYDRCEYLQGDEWFEMAAERGANDIDDVIERIVRMTKDKDQRREVVHYLLNKDPVRYCWARSYVKQEKV
ncbi:hypothetical protein ACN4EG_19640 [Alkalinema pantanalense CENA528]|uniref:hypothetical protein n=1 Tax=Alkalinema pantanalense TaxID=1620705 RepID=UPI003D6EAA3D